MAVCLAGAAIAAGAALGTAPPVRAQLELPPLLPSPGAPLLPPLLPGLLSPPTSPPTASPSASAAASAPSVAHGDDTGEYARCSPRGDPPPRGPRSRPRNTKPLVEAAQPLVERGVPLDEAMAALAPPFPVAGYARFSDDWLNPRTTPCPHWHMGTDIFADFGTPIVASGPGVVNARGRHAVGGLSVWVTGDDRMSYYYAHLERFGNITPGQRVEAGTILGYVGDTGNAEGGAPHLHFSIHPPTRTAHGVVSSGSGTLGRSITPYANPKPYLDRWLDQAVSRAPGLVQALGRRIDEDPSVRADLTSLLRSTELAGFAAAPGTGPFGLPWSGVGLAAGLLGVLVVVQAVLVIGRTARIGRRGPAAEAGAPGPWRPAWAEPAPNKHKRHKGVHRDRTAKPRFVQHDRSGQERPPGLR